MKYLFSVLVVIAVSLMVTIVALPYIYPTAGALLTDQWAQSIEGSPMQAPIQRMAQNIKLAAIIAVGLAVALGLFLFVTGRFKTDYSVSDKKALFSDSVLVIVVMLFVAFILSFVHNRFPHSYYWLFWVPWTVAYFSVCVRRHKAEFLHLVRVAVSVSIFFIALELALKFLDEFHLNEVVKLFGWATATQVLSVTLGGWIYRFLEWVAVQQHLKQKR